MATDAGKGQIAYARLAGAMFLLVDALYALGMYITGRFRVPGNVVETGHRIMQSEALYRAGVASVVLAALCTVLIAVGLYGALKPVDGRLAATGLVFRTAEATLFGVQAIVAFAFLKLYTGVDGSGFTPAQLSTLVAIRSAAGDAGYNTAALFFSFGSTAFFYLFLKSGYIPRWLSVLGFAGSLLVPIACLGGLIFALPASIYWGLWAPVGVAEVVLGFWLVIRGLDLPRPAERADATSFAGAAPAGA